MALVNCKTCEKEISPNIDGRDSHRSGPVTVAISVGVFKISRAEAMANRGNKSKPDPISTYPCCKRYFEHTKSSCPHCGYKRGDLDKRASRKWQKPTRKDIVDTL
jgi:ribosomal protein L37E